ncbi:hypothetical protein CR983_00915 [Candidatus Saccharibacteria bacterium]|nr:MAG: hypothetical protein CR983_00915 [Candidatus Saccharibacteria bacterium]
MVAQLQPKASPHQPPAPQLNDKPPIRNYWPYYQRQSISLTILAQILATTVLGGSLLITGIGTDRLEFWLIIMAALVASSLINIFIMLLIVAPFRDVLTAITRMAGEPTDEALPNPNARNYEKHGFGTLLQYLYALPSATHSDSNEAQSVERFEAALRRIRGGIAILDESGQLLYATDGVPQTIDSDGNAHLELVFDSRETISEWLASVAQHEVHADRIWLRVPDKLVGEENRRIYNISASYEQGSSAPLTLLFFDNSDYYQPEDDQLDFIAFAAHELRGPVTVIRGYLDVFAQEIAGQPGQQETELLLSRLIVSANRLGNYISNILNVSRYDRRHLQVHLSEQSLAAIYDSIRDDMSLRASSQNRKLSVNIPPDLPTVAADPNTLSEVFANLIDNAIKYSHEGGTVTISANEDRGMVRVDVIDRGIGMPKNVMRNLFHKFYRSHRSRETVAGTGIGLYITKAIIESHGGTIEVQSEEGKGTTFRFTVPIYATVADQLAARDDGSLGLITNPQATISNHAKYRG